MMYRKFNNNDENDYLRLGDKVPNIGKFIWLGSPDEVCSNIENIKKSKQIAVRDIAEYSNSTAFQLFSNKKSKKKFL